MLGAGFGGSVQLGWEDPLVWPLEEGSIGWGCVGVVVLAGYVEGEVEEGLTARFDKRGETGRGVSSLVDLWAILGVRTQRYRLFAPHPGSDPGSMLPPIVGGGSRRYCGTGSPRLSHFEEREARLCTVIC